MKSQFLLLALAAPAVHAATLTQMDSFTIDETYGTVVGSVEVFDGDWLSTQVDPFDPALGTLQSFTLTWSLSGSFTGTLSAGGGGASVAYNGPFLIQSLGFPTTGNGDGSGGGGNGNGGPGGMELTVPFPSPSGPTSFSRTFFVADAGSDYDAAILGAIQGASPVTLEWDTPLTVNGGFDALTVDGAGSVQLSYDYVPVPEPAVPTLAGLLGVLLLGRRRRA